MDKHNSTFKWPRRLEYPWKFVGWVRREEKLDKELKKAEAKIVEELSRQFFSVLNVDKEDSKAIKAWRKFQAIMETHINSKKKYDRYDVAQYYGKEFLIESMLKYVFELKYSIDHYQDIDLPTVRSIAHIAQQLHTRLTGGGEEGDGRSEG